MSALTNIHGTGCYCFLLYVEGLLPLAPNKVILPSFDVLTEAVGLVCLPGQMYLLGLWETMFDVTKFL